eukprot:1161625-Pelagomonas_calceolata.AAC.14
MRTGTSPPPLPPERASRLRHWKPAAAMAPKWGVTMAVSACGDQQAARVFSQKERAGHDTSGKQSCIGEGREAVEKERRKV